MTLLIGPLHTKMTELLTAEAKLVNGYNLTLCFKSPPHTVAQFEEEFKIEFILQVSDIPAAILKLVIKDSSTPLDESITFHTDIDFCQKLIKECVWKKSCWIGSSNLAG